MKFAACVRRTHEASLQLSQHLEKLHLEKLDPGIVASRDALVEMHANLFNPEMEEASPPPRCTARYCAALLRIDCTARTARRCYRYPWQYAI